MKIQSTKVSETEQGLAIELLIADANQIDDASEFVHLRVVSEKAEGGWRLPTIHREALQLSLDVLNSEIQGARDAVNRFDD